MAWRDGIDGVGGLSMENHRKNEDKVQIRWRTLGPAITALIALQFSLFCSFRGSSCRGSSCSGRWDSPQAVDPHSDRGGGTKLMWEISVQRSSI